MAGQGYGSIGGWRPDLRRHGPGLRRQHKESGPINQADPDQDGEARIGHCAIAKILGGIDKQIIMLDIKTRPAGFPQPGGQNKK